MLSRKKEETAKEEFKVVEYDPFNNNFEEITDDDELPF